ncbi:MAG: exosortase system-associated protein, TIGR04073 family [Candidatus Omnitrophica bacterium]|nr:exosortase system-associated protein, TIGR04073 family [Candidatus Omnitrophota bacterium]
MRRFFLIAVVLWVVLTVSPVEAAEDNPIRKLTRGLTNIVTGWTEVPIQVARVTETDGSVAGSTIGLVKGFFFGIGRTGVGLLETVTFPLPNYVGSEGPHHQAYGPIVEPEFVVVRSADIGSP